MLIGDEFDLKLSRNLFRWRVIKVHKTGRELAYKAINITRRGNTGKSVHSFIGHGGQILHLPNSGRSATYDYCSWSDVGTGWLRPQCKTDHATPKPPRFAVYCCYCGRLMRKKNDRFREN